MAHDSGQQERPEKPAPDVANPGLIRPPVLYLGSIGLGLLIHWLWPFHWLPSASSLPIGILLVVVSGALFIFAVRELRSADTPVPGNRPTTAIVRTGPYRFSRNPIYLAFTLFQLGLAAWANSLGLLLTLLPALTLIAMVVIPREERHLEARFPAEYSRYKGEVRRWL